MNASSALREKYRLVHVPRRERIAVWATVARRNLEEGLPEEAAGVAAAREVFPYEAKERPAPDAPAVRDILALIAGEAGA